MSTAPVVSRWTDAPREWGCAAGSLLACIYTCEAHRPLLERFHASEVGILLRETPGVRIVEVYADEEVPVSRLDGSRIVLRSKESYLELSLKTHRMIEFSVDNFGFDNLLKIDITTVMTQSELGSPEYSERKAMDMGSIADFLRLADYGRDYVGLILHERAGREGAENWARKKGQAIDYARLFGDGPMPPFYSGKCYVISRRFAEFIARFGADVADEQRRYFLGSEDVMVGRMYDRFRSIAPT
jgi:hypothetical protein